LWKLILNYYAERACVLIKICFYHLSHDCTRRSNYQNLKHKNTIDQKNNKKHQLNMKHYYKQKSHAPKHAHLQTKHRFLFLTLFCFSCVMYIAGRSIQNKFIHILSWWCWNEIQYLKAQWYNKNDNILARIITIMSS
jgi:hypothetical protein